MKKTDQPITINSDGEPLLQVSAKTAMALGLALQHTAQVRGASRGSVAVYLEMCEMLSAGARPGQLVVLPPPARNHSRVLDAFDALGAGAATLVVALAAALVLRGDLAAAGWFAFAWLAASAGGWVALKVLRHVGKGGDA